MLEKPPVNEALQEITQQLGNHGFQCYLVGGAIRNHLLHYPIKDYDLATDALPYQVMTLFKRVIKTGIEHGTVTIMVKDRSFEITTFRADGTYSDGRRPDSVQFMPNIIEDLKRRDFTINSIAYDLINQGYADPNNGLTDLNNRIIKAIGNPMARFTEDGLRPIRALRFVAQLGFTLDEATYLAISECLLVTKEVSKERVRDELRKMFVAPYASQALYLMRDSGLMQLLLPELYNSLFCYYNKNVDLLSHQIAALSAIPAKYEKARWAALFAYLAYPLQEIQNEELLFTETLALQSSTMFVKLAKNLKLTNRAIKEISHLIKNQRCWYQRTWSDAQIRLLIKQIGLFLWPSYLALLEGQRRVAQNPAFNQEDLVDLKRRADVLLQQPLVIDLAQLALNGDDLITLGVPKDQQMRELLNLLLNKVIEDPSLNTKEQLVCIAEQIRKEKG